MIQDKIFFDEKDPTGLSYNTPFTYYGSYQGRLWSKSPSGSIQYYTQNSDLSAYATTGSNQFSGSQTVTGSLTVTGTITGTVAGTTSTASYVEYTNVANKPALISGSSQVTYSGLTGIPSGIVSGSAQISNFGIFATTGSNGFNGSQSITGSLTVTGQVVAQTLNVQQVTSSIVYSSGSNVFGNSLANTQQFTGSMLVTGSLTVAGAGMFSSSVEVGGTSLIRWGLDDGTSNARAWGIRNGYNTSGDLVVLSSSTNNTTLNTVQLQITRVGAAIFNNSITIGESRALNWGERGGISQDGSYNFNWSTNGVANAFHLQSATGNVGIGTTSPKAKLQIRGSVSSEKKYDGREDGLILYYPFSENTGTTTVDRSQTGANGTLTNGPTWASGIFGYGVTLDGSNDYVSVASPDSSISLGTTMTYAMWIYPTSTADIRYYLFDPRGDGSSGGTNSYFLFDRVNSTTVNFTAGNSGIEVISGNVTMGVNQWFHVAATRSGNTWRIYLNGVQITSGTTNTTSLTLSNSFRIGTYSSAGVGPLYYFAGTLDEARMYNRTLTANEVMTLYLEGVGTSAPYTNASGNVGIGTSDPQYKLDVYSSTSPATIGLKSDATYNSIIRDYHTSSTSTFLDITTERTDGGGFNFLLLVSSTLTASGANRNYYTFAVQGRGTTATATQLSNVSAGTSSRTAIAVSFPSNGVIRLTLTGGEACQIKVTAIGHGSL